MKGALGVSGILCIAIQFTETAGGCTLEVVDFNTGNQTNVLEYCKLLLSFGSLSKDHIKFTEVRVGAAVAVIEHKRLTGARSPALAAPAINRGEMDAPPSLSQGCCLVRALGRFWRCQTASASCGVTRGIVNHVAALFRILKPLWTNHAQHH